ncbi:MAG: hypothetical protein Q4C96_08120 [Planctomycetia bacterium]|nr:hypothetical protein [Planctomycetia bacterium]
MIADDTSPEKTPPIIKNARENDRPKTDWGKMPPKKGAKERNPNFQGNKKNHWNNTQNPSQERPNWHGNPPHADMHEFMYRRNMEEFKNAHPKLFELMEQDIQLNKKAARLKELWKNAKIKEQKEEIQKELKNVITEHFKVRQERRLYELTLLEEKIKNMRKEIKNREAKMDKIINYRLKFLLEIEEGLEF